MRLALKAMMGLGAVAVVLGADRWFKLFQNYLANININLSDYILVSLIAVMCAIGIYDHRSKNSEKKTDFELQGKIKHIENDLLPAYRRLIGLETEQKDDKLVLMVNPVNRARKRIETMDEAVQDIWEREHSPKTRLDVMTNGDSALDHLKHKDYKDIYQHFVKAKELVDKFNQNHDESLKPQIDQSVLSFKRGLLPLMDRLDNNHLLKGKCSSCP